MKEIPILYRKKRRLLRMYGLLCRLPQRGNFYGQGQRGV